MELALEFVGVTRSYPHRDASVVALADASFALPKGSFTCVLGPSGSGKSTLLALAGLMDAPSSGRVLLGGVDAGAWDERTRDAARLSRVGFVFQHHYLVPTLTAEENVALPLKAANVDRGARAARLDTLFAAVGLESRRSHFPHELSGGEQQRVAVARALANAPDILLADEPTASLDEEASAAVMRLIEEAHARGATVMLVTHDPRIVPDGARVLRVQQGHVEGAR